MARAGGTVIAVDSGGTFTDCVVLDAQGRITIGKAPSTPQDFSIGSLDAVAQRRARGGASSWRSCSRSSLLFSLGTTAATNALLTRTGSRVGLITTKGHEDAVIIGRTIQKAAGLNTAELTNLARLEKADPIVPRHLIRGVTERIDYKGAVIVSLDARRGPRRGRRSSSRPASRRSPSACCGASSIPRTRRRGREIISAEHPQLAVTASHQVAPVIKEYERGATTMLNAYLSGATDRSISALEERLAAGGLRRRRSSCSPRAASPRRPKAKGHAIRLVASGPAGGRDRRRGGRRRRSASPNVITTDVGGTSFDVGLVVDGEPLVNAAPGVRQVPHGAAGRRRRLDRRRAAAASPGSRRPPERSRSGPQSAGADPGPACYGNGGEQPTVTDANVVLGRIDPASFLGGARPLAPRARRAGDRASGSATPLGLSVARGGDGDRRHPRRPHGRSRAPRDDRPRL